MPLRYCVNWRAANAVGARMTAEKTRVGTSRQAGLAKKVDQARAREASERIRRVAIRLFSARGYHGTSMRELAAAAQLEPASLYYHYLTKQELLSEVFRWTMEQLLEGARTAVESLGSGATARQQLVQLVRFHVGFHVEHQDEAFVSHSELRALDPAQREAVVAVRDQYQTILRRVLEAGVTQGEFDIPDVRLMATAILTLSSGVSDWYGPAGRLNGKEVAQEYVELVLRMVRCASSPATSG